MTDNHPITPPPELIKQWVKKANHNDPLFAQVAVMGAQWGADQELEACCEWLHWQNLATHTDLIPSLRAAMRPKSPSLRKQAYDALDTYIYGEPDPKDKERTYNTIRRALEQLND